MSDFTTEPQRDLMSCRSAWRLCLPLFLFAVVLPALSSQPQWVEVRSPHFSVVTDAGEKRGRDAALRFEQLRAVFGALMKKENVSLPPLQIVAFRNTKEMLEFAPLWRGKPTEVAGLFEGNNDRRFILLDMSVREPWQVVYHEYAHQLLNGNSTSQFPPWFEEGFAEYFSTIKVTGKDAEVGLISNTDAQVLLRPAGMMKIADLFRVQHDSSTYNESGDHRSVFYAQSWLVMHYLYDQHLMPKAEAYLEAAKQPGVTVEQAIQEGFGMSASDLDKQIRRYWEDGKWRYYRMPTPVGIDRAGYAVRQLGMADAKAVLADAHLHSADYQEKGVTECEEALKLQPDNAAALRGLGYAYLRKRDFHRAAEYFLQAVQHDPNDPRALYYSGLAAEMGEGQNLRSDPARLASIQKNLQVSVALDAEFADTYAVLAFTYMLQGNYEPALDEMRKAVALNPGNQEYLLNLDQIYLATPSVRFVKGRVAAVDCSGPPGALLTVVSGAQTWKLRVKDSGRVIVVGADSFSCAWKDRTVGVNYRTTGDGNGEVVSIEVQ